MDSAIILRDIPKKQVKIDMALFPAIEGGFRGFSHVPAGLHYVSVKSHDSHIGFWSYVKSGDALVKIFNSEDNCFEDDLSESEIKYKQLALSGSLGSALKVYPHQFFPAWLTLSSYIKAEHFPPKIFESDPISHSRFESAFKGTHNGKIDSFLQEFQFSFLKWHCSTLTSINEDSAFERWKFLLFSVYNAGVSNISENPHLFINLITIIITQFRHLGEDFFQEGDSLLENWDTLSKDMEDSGNAEVRKKAQEFSEYILNR